MKVKLELEKYYYDDGHELTDWPIEVDEPSQCPQCKHAIKPEVIGIHPYVDDNYGCFLVITYLCKHCFRPFITLYSTADYGIGVMVSTEPTRFIEQKFDSLIVNLSPAFVKIYNQALAAENLGHDEIAGVGYRKSLEFLIKDYLIHQTPEEKDKIEDLALAKCIKQYIDSRPLQLTAERCVWLGNDHAHYKQKHTDKDLADLKRLLNASVSWVHLMLVTEEAAAMEPAGQK